MAEKQEPNPFLAAMNAEKPTSTPPVEDTIAVSKYSVNPAAENTVNVVAVVLLVIGIIGAAVGLIGGLVMFAEDEAGTGWAFFGIGLALFLTGLLEWAFLKVFVNISRNLYNINDALHELKNK